MKCFQQVLLISVYLLVSIQPSVGMSEDSELRELGFYAPPPKTPLPTSSSKETSQDTLGIAQEIRGSIRSQIDEEEGIPREPICVDALFLGPRGENAGFFLNLVQKALEDHLHWRQSFHPEDPFRITEEIKQSPGFLHVQDNFQRQLCLLLAKFKKYSNPLFSPRYQAHMNWETTMISLEGYIATLLYNPNNVAFEGAPVTAYLEEQVARDLCQMIGYRIADVKAAESSDPLPIVAEFSDSDPISWGHLTGGGTIANAEALWAARNVKFFPFSVQQALQREELLQSARDVTVTLPNKKQTSLIGIKDPWKLLNIEADEALKLPERIFNLLPSKPGSSAENTEKIMSFAELYKLLSKYSIQEIGLLNVYELLNNGDKKVKSPVVLVSGTRHYSFPKAISLLGLGQGNLIDIPVNKKARIDLGALETKLHECRIDRRPIIAVAAIMGSTEESAIDPLQEILEKRITFRSQGTDFHIHADAAWGGYFATLLPKPGRTLVPVIGLSKHAVKHLAALKEADSVTIDPHKSGYMPYPAAALCFRNEGIINMVNFTAPYLSAQEKTKEPTLGNYGIEGSKPGASAAMVYLTHRVIPLDKNGYGVLLGQALYSAKDFYRQLLALNTESNTSFFVVPLAQSPDSAALQRIDALRNTLIETVQYPHPSSKTQKRDLKTLRDQLNQELKEIGPDLNIVAYAFNFYDSPGVLNSRLDQANAFNEAIYNKLRPQLEKPTSELNLIVSNTSLEKSKYGEVILENFLGRLEIAVPSTPNYAVTALRSVIMNPWITETTEGSFVDTLMRELTQTIHSVLQEMSEGSSSASTSNSHIESSL